MYSGENHNCESISIKHGGLPSNPIHRFIMDGGVCLFETNRRLWYEPPKRYVDLQSAAGFMRGLESGAVLCNYFLP